MIYELRAAHVFQRRFDSEALAAAVSDCHLYIISRRPGVRVIGETVRTHPDSIAVVGRIVDGVSCEAQKFTLPVDSAMEPSDFRLHDDGAYFSFRTGGQMWHGDTWSLAALATRGQGPIAMHEVLYIGKAFGSDGTSSAWHRTRRHEKLQRIYEDHVGGPDVFVTPLRIHQSSLLGLDHIADGDDRGPNLANYYGVFADAKGAVLAPTVELLEHALIAYFVPPYNENLTQWRVEAPSKPMRQMAAAGLRLLKVHLNGADGLARFRSRQVPHGTRSHLITHDFPTGRRTAVPRGISATEISAQRAAMLGLDDTESVMTADEAATVTLRVFGVRAPRTRKPASVDLEDDVYAQMDRYCAELGRLPDVIPYDGRPLFDPQTGAVSLGEDAEGTVIRQTIVDTQGQPMHAMVLGPAGSGKSNTLTMLTLGMMQARPTLLWTADAVSRHLPRMRAVVRSGLADWAAVDLTELELILGAAVALAERPGQGSLSGPDGGAFPLSILITIEDAHHAFRAPRLRTLAERLVVAGPRAGISMAITMPDENIARFGGSTLLRKAFADGIVMCLGEEDALLTMEAVRKTT
jgi:hypothetical protein